MNALTFDHQHIYVLIRFTSLILFEEKESGKAKFSVLWHRCRQKIAKSSIKDLIGMTELLPLL
jgi:hypothetical protein